MGDDPGHTDRSTDEEFEGLRHVRFGKLPAQSRRGPGRDDRTGPPHEASEQPPVRREWGRSCSRESGSRTGRGRPSHRTDPGNHRRASDAVRVPPERAFLLPEATRLPFTSLHAARLSPAMNRAIPRRHGRPVSGTHIGPSGRAAARHDGQSAQTVGSASGALFANYSSGSAVRRRRWE